MPGVPGGEHYDVGGIAVIDFNRAKLTLTEFRGACRFNINKYMNRKKGADLADYKKARDYLNWLIETYEKTSDPALDGTADGQYSKP